MSNILSAFLSESHDKYSLMIMAKGWLGLIMRITVFFIINPSHFMSGSNEPILSSMPKAFHANAVQSV